MSGVSWWRGNTSSSSSPSPSRFFKQTAAQDFKRLIFKYDFISLQRRHLLWRVNVSPEEETYLPPPPPPLISSPPIIWCHLDSLSSTPSHLCSAAVTSPPPPLCSPHLISPLILTVIYTHPSRQRVCVRFYSHISVLVFKTGRCRQSWIPNKKLHC